MTKRKDLRVVLIESDWNLKVVVACNENSQLSVLIESDWNLKEGLEYGELNIAKEY